MMMKTLITFFCCLALVQQVKADNKILFYFNHPVDTSVAKGVKAVYLNDCLADTFVAYVNRAKYTIDITQYDYNQSSGYANIATAINNAYNRGVKIRWIYDGSSYNGGLSLLNAAIYTLGSPTSSAYNIMHNKFVVFDAYSVNATDAIVWTGSPDWSLEQFNADYNNVVVLQDSALAHAYTDEFNMMWGDTGIAPNQANSKFGPFKTDLGRHQFTIDGKQVELYFSPSDNTNDHIQTAIASANNDLYFGVYTFTDKTDANEIINMKNTGVYTAGIEDQYSKTYAPYNIFMSGLGGSNFKVYTSSATIYHNKFLIVDPSNPCSDPLVLTGSHNWTSAANTQNDENTIIIHDSTAANIYYQSFRADFAHLGGTLTLVKGCDSTTAVDNVSTEPNHVAVFPNPSDKGFNISYDLATTQPVSIQVSDVLGKIVAIPVNRKIQVAGHHQCDFQPVAQGVYFIMIRTGNDYQVQKVIKTY